MGKRHADANYDDVQMDMSDDNDEAALPSEATMFSSKDEFKAYQKQFSSSSSSSTHNTTDPTRSATEYGSGMAASTDRQPRRSADNHSHHTTTSRKVDDSGDEHPRNHKDRRRDHDDSRRRRHRDGHRRRDRSRSRSRDRGQHHRRRSRSRERDDQRQRDRRQSRDDDNRRFPPAGFPPAGFPPRPKVSNVEQERQDSRSRKLQSLGLLNNKGETLATQMEKVKEITGVEVPKYYNPAAINPLRYAEQIKKRQMLWKKPTNDDKDPQPCGSSQPSNIAVATTEQVTPEKKPGAGILARQPSSQPAGSFNKWETTNFGNDKTNEKFRRLMGRKGGGGAPTPSTDSPSSVQKGSAKLFELQEQQYEKARAITHTARGLGLGFTPQAAPTPSTSALPPPGPSP